MRAKYWRGIVTCSFMTMLVLFPSGSLTAYAADEEVKHFWTLLYEVYQGKRRFKTWAEMKEGFSNGEFASCTKKWATWYWDTLKNFLPGYGEGEAIGQVIASVQTGDEDIGWKAMGEYYSDKVASLALGGILGDTGIKDDTLKDIISTAAISYFKDYFGNSKPTKDQILKAMNDPYVLNDILVYALDKVGGSSDGTGQMCLDLKRLTHELLGNGESSSSSSGSGSGSSDQVCKPGDDPDKDAGVSGGEDSGSGSSGGTDTGDLVCKPGDDPDPFDEDPVSTKKDAPEINAPLNGKAKGNSSVRKTSNGGSHGKGKGGNTSSKIW